MKTNRLLSTIVILLVTGTLFLAACAPAAPTAPAKDMSDPVTVVQSFYEILNTGDVERAMELTAEDYVMNDPFGTYDRSAAAIQWQAVVDAGLSFNQTNFIDTGNGRVTSCYEVFENGSSIDKGCGNVTHVRESKIIFDGLEAAEQIWIVQKYYEALNARNLDLAMSYIARDAVFINPTGTYEGAEAIRESLAGLNQDGITFDLSNFRNTDGKIIYDYKVMQSGNLLDQGTNGLTIVKDGIVVFDGIDNTVSIRPQDVVQGFWDAVNSQNFETAMSLVTDDIKCRGTLYTTGKASFQTYIESTYKGTGRTYEISNLVVSGDTVTYDWQSYRDGVFQAGGTGESMIVNDGKIVQFNGT